MFKDVRWKKFKDSKLGNFFGDLKFIAKEYSIDMLCIALAGKAGNPYRIKRQLLGLTRKGYFDISKENNRSFFRLTPKGYGLVEWLKFVTGKIKWDGKWRVLVFDIPEKQRLKRDSLRARLAGFGFKKLQESVWITPFPLPENFTDFLTNLRVRPYLYSLTVDAVNREEELKKLFRLK